MQIFVDLISFVRGMQDVYHLLDQNLAKTKV